MNTFELKIALGNDAMLENMDIAAALRTVAARVGNGELSGKIRDINGNTCGLFTVI